MPPRLRIPLLVAATVALTGALALGLWRHEQSGVHAQARADARAAATAIEDRAGSAVLALQGLRAAYDFSPGAFERTAGVPLRRPEIVAVGWAPRVPAAERSSLEATERIRIAAPADALFTYPLLLATEAAQSTDVVDLGSDPSLGRALRQARTSGAPRISAPVRLPDGRLGSYAFVPVFRQGALLDTPGRRKDALRGLVVGALAAAPLVEGALAGLGPARVTDGPSVLSAGPATGVAVSRANVGGRTWRIAVPVASPSPLAPSAVALLGLALALVLLSGSRLLARARDDVRALRQALTRLRVRTAEQLQAAQEQVARSEEAVELVAAVGEAAVLDVDGDGIIRSCSGALGQLLGYTDADLRGTAIYALLHPDDLLAPPSGPQRYARSDGEYVVLESRRLTRRDPLGFAAGVVTVLREPTRADATRTVAQRLADAVALEPDPVELFSIVAEETALELDVRSASVVRFETTGFGSVVGAWTRDEAGAMRGTTVDLAAGPVGTVYREGRAVTGAAPLRVGARLWGALVADGVDVTRLSALAEISQGTIAFADASSRLTALATRDALTNLPDHRAFQEQLRAEVRRAQRHERALSLVLLNLDGFRRLNDEHGRLAGDRVLAEVSRRLGATIRQGEIVSRLGGDHFGWILPETEGLNGWIGAERARRAISTVSFEGIGTVTASAGVCDLEDLGGADELLALTEVALVHAKSSGGDATFRYSAELDESESELEPEETRPLQRLRTLAQELDANDPGLDGHSERVARLAEKLALSAGWRSDQAVRLSQAAFVHDVGKVSVSEDVLRKQGPLDESELEEIRNHPDTGAAIAVNALDQEQVSWVRYHHERWDGTGYPSQLAGELIPAGARLLALAEAWDAMTSAKSYGEALSVEAALAECRSEDGKQFAPEAVSALERLWKLGALTPADLAASTEL